MNVKDLLGVCLHAVQNGYGDCPVYASETANLEKGTITKAGNCLIVHHRDQYIFAVAPEGTAEAFAARDAKAAILKAAKTDAEF